MMAEELEVLHEDDPKREGNLSAEDYLKTYNDGPWCGPPADVVAEAEKQAKGQQT